MMPFRRNKFRQGMLLVATLLIIVIGGLLIALWSCPPKRIVRPVTAELTAWPWANAEETKPWRGITSWTVTARDGTFVRLVEFDFETNPNLRFGMYDQDEDDANPFDDSVDFWPKGVWQATEHLQGNGKGRVVAAWNGLFFSREAGRGTQGTAHHVTATVNNGVVRYNVGNHRWAFGARNENGSTEFDVRHMPNRKELAQAFTYASGGAQCLIRNGNPLKLRSIPSPDDPPVPQPFPSTPQEAGHIPVVDHIKTSRVSMAWTEDSKKFYLLFVLQPGAEQGSIRAYRMLDMQPTGFRRSWRRTVEISGESLASNGGWDLADLQRFWMSKGVWGAINSDAGDVAQLDIVRPDGRYDLYPARWATGTRAMIAKPGDANVPAGGSLMYFYMRDIDVKTALATPSNFNGP